MAGTPSVALIAGQGTMPLSVLEGVHRAGKKVFLLALKGITDKTLEASADKTVWLSLFQLGKAVRLCHKLGVKEVVMAGRVKHTSIFSLHPWKIDWTTLKLLYRLPDRRTDTLLNAIGELFAKKGIALVDSTLYVQHMIAKTGCLTQCRPSKKAWKDIEFGISIAKELGRLDIGQTVVVKERAVVALEAMEGTNACIIRGGELAGKGCVVVKMAKPDQDMRFDVPTIGITTIEKLAHIDGAAIAVEAGKTLILDEGTVDAADKLGIPIVSLKG
ncbi:UDP-2,3-diacylglucosamine diphosphatase LpxI [Simkania negevensis]|uniref:UDP-2,3-diacylglucosamine diphosphatase LpxI n=1 Tax=Simkania negevensis TaxID=83561 RepID=A0ABS3AR18_9BACT|nr:UDP-2,3-diacylglucosamine diphosphatase LpxI [Simkania negevensis]